MGDMLTLDIHSDRVTAVVLEQEKARVLKRWATMPVEGDLSEVLGALIHQLGYAGKDCRVGFGEEYFSFRKVSLPFSNRAKVSQVLPFELDDQFSVDAESYHFDFRQFEQADGFCILVALIKRDKCSELLASLQNAGLDPSLCTISGTAAASFLMKADETLVDFLLLDIEHDHTMLSLIRNRQVTCMRSLRIQFSGETPEQSPEEAVKFCDKLVRPVRQTLLAEQASDVFIDGIPVYISGAVGCSFHLRDILKEKISKRVEICNPVSMPLFKIDNENEQEFNPAMISRSLSLALCSHTDKTLSLFNVRRGQFRKQMSLDWVKRYGALIALCLGGLAMAAAIFAWWDYRNLYTEQEQLKKEIETVYRETQPGVTRIVNPVQQLQLAINDVKDTYGIASADGVAVDKLLILTDISARVPDSLPMLITRFVADFDGVDIKAETDDFNKIEAIKNSIEKSVLFSEVIISSANLDQKSGKVRFDLKLVLQVQ